MGANAFTLQGIKKYSKELKQRSSRGLLLAGYGFSKMIFAKVGGIRSKAKLQIWIKKYNGHEELKIFLGNRGKIIMTKGKKHHF